MIKNGYLVTRNSEITSDFIFTRTELQEAIGTNLSNGTFSNSSVFLTTKQGGLRITAPDENNFLLYLGTDPSTEQFLGVFNKDPQNENMFNFYYDNKVTFYLNLQVVNEPLLSKLLPFVEKTDFEFKISHDYNSFFVFITSLTTAFSLQYFEFNVSIGDTQYRDYSNEPFIVLGNATYKMSVRSIVTETVLDNDLEYIVLWSAGTPVISNRQDKGGKYITINVPDSPTNTPVGNVYRNGGSEPVGTYKSTGNKTAKWYITDSPIGENGDAYTANQVYNGVYGFLSNTILVNWTYIEWSLHEEPNHIIRVNAKDLGSFSNIKIYKNEEVTPIIDKTPSGNYDELFDVSAYGPATYKVVVTPRAGYKFDSDYTDTQYITLNLETIEIQTEFNEINGELSANKNEYIEQMNVTPNEGWTRKDYRTVVINESGTYTISLISNSTWYILIPVPATYNIIAALDTPILNVEMSNQLDLVWDETDSTTYYEIYQDGVLIDSVPSESNNTLMARSIENKEKKRWIKNV